MIVVRDSTEILIWEKELGSDLPMLQTKNNSGAVAFRWPYVASVLTNCECVVQSVEKPRLRVTI